MFYLYLLKCWAIWTIALLTINFSLASYEYNLAICSMFKNEAPWLKEWIEYHRLLGVTHFYLYNNESTDAFRPILDPYIKQGIVELIEWPSIPENKYIGATSWDGYQVMAFNECMKRSLGRARWVAVIDIDEYIVPIRGIRSFHSLLNREFRKKTGSIVLKWRIFGTSNCWKIPLDKLMIECLYMRAEDRHQWNSNIKCIHRPEAISYCYVHWAQLKTDYYEKLVDYIRINHYWSRDQINFYRKRRELSVSCYEELIDKAEISELIQARALEKDINQVEDRVIWQYIPNLKKALNKS